MAEHEEGCDDDAQVDDGVHDGCDDDHEQGAAVAHDDQHVVEFITFVSTLIGMQIR